MVTASSMILITVMGGFCQYHYLDNARWTMLGGTLICYLVSFFELMYNTTPEGLGIWKKESDTAFANWMLLSIGSFIAACSYNQLILPYIAIASSLIGAIGIFSISGFNFIDWLSTLGQINIFRKRSSY